ncbi:hypothetical protein [Paenibacillus harenae]|uniref:hypothetical protein n=1 Tax=Paenibacillus harenae TaxID=306543 RepID=UPI00048E888C|nr:hypothetical protein [Paenibacillus harenae]
MIKKQLQLEESLLLKEQLNSLWNILDYYWYPLAQTNRDDVIAFGFPYINDELKIDFLKNGLIRHGVTDIYEYWAGKEHCYENALTQDAKQLFWNSDPYFFECYNEGFWFSKQMDWIIYFTHEETCTIGGEWLVTKVKQEWKDWNRNIKWDTKNDKSSN